MENVVTKGAKAAEPMEKVPTSVVPDNQSLISVVLPPRTIPMSPKDSAKLKDAAAPLKQVKDVVNKGAKAADPMKEIVGKSAIPSGEGTTDARSAGSSRLSPSPASVVPWSNP